MFPVIVAMLLDELFFLFLKSYMSRVYYSVGITLHFIRYHISLQCFDAVGWVAGRAPACKKLSGGVLAWLSVWSEVQTCIWSS